MYRIWIGLNPRMVLHLFHSAIAIFVLFMHLWAFSAVNFPGHIKVKYPNYFAAPAATAVR